MQQLLDRGACSLAAGDCADALITASKDEIIPCVGGDAGCGGSDPCRTSTGDGGCWSTRDQRLSAETVAQICFNTGSTNACTAAATRGGDGNPLQFVGKIAQTVGGAVQRAFLVYVNQQGQYQYQEIQLAQVQAQAVEDCVEKAGDNLYFAALGVAAGALPAGVTAGATSGVVTGGLGTVIVAGGTGVWCALR